GSAQADRGRIDATGKATLSFRHQTLLHDRAGTTKHFPNKPFDMKTFSAKPSDITQDWYVVDAAGRTLGRLASAVAHRLRGKHKAIFTPHMDTGDYIIVTNVEKLRVTGNKAMQKKYYRHS